MGEVQTTAGAVDSSELGKTLIHEHFRGRDEAVAAQWPHVYDEDEEWNACIDQADAVKEHGVKTIVEPTAMLLGRDIDRSSSGSPPRPASTSSPAPASTPTTTCPTSS